jgi:hypothetical protein
MKVFRRGQSCHSSSEETGHQPCDEGANEDVNTDGTTDHCTYDSNHEQEREFRARSIRNDILTQSKKEERSENNQKQQGARGNGQRLHRVCMGENQ